MTTNLTDAALADEAARIEAALSAPAPGDAGPVAAPGPVTLGDIPPEDIVVSSPPSVGSVGSVAEVVSTTETVTSSTSGVSQPSSGRGRGASASTASDRTGYVRHTPTPSVTGREFANGITAEASHARVSTRVSTRGAMGNILATSHALAGSGLTGTSMKPKATDGNLAGGQYQVSLRISGARPQVAPAPAAGLAPGGAGTSANRQALLGRLSQIRGEQGERGLETKVNGGISADDAAGNEARAARDIAAVKSGQADSVSTGSLTYASLSRKPELSLKDGPRAPRIDPETGNLTDGGSSGMA